MWLMTLLKLFRHAMVCNGWYFCPYKLCNICLFRCVSLILFCFDEYQSFLWTFAVLLQLLLWNILRPFGNLHINAISQSHYLESHYQHSISNGIGTAKTLFFSCIQYTSILFLLLVIWHQYHFDTSLEIWQFYGKDPSLPCLYTLQKQ